MRDDMVTHMNGVKERRIIRDAWQVILSRRKAAAKALRKYRTATYMRYRKSDAFLFPNAHDFCEMPQVQALISGGNDVELGLFGSLPVADIVEAWRSNAYDYMIAFMQLHTHARGFEEYAYDRSLAISKIDAGDIPLYHRQAQVIQDLSLATTVFTCNSCGGCLSHTHPDEFYLDKLPWDHPYHYRHHSDLKRPMFFPEVMGHTCLTRGDQAHGYAHFPGPKWGWGWEEDPTVRVYGSGGYRVPWTPTRICLDDKMSAYARELVQHAGLDPLTATPEAMDQLELAFRCSDCSSDDMETDGPISERWFGWRHAVSENLQVPTPTTLTHP